MRSRDEYDMQELNEFLNTGRRRLFVLVSERRSTVLFMQFGAIAIDNGRGEQIASRARRKTSHLQQVALPFRSMTCHVANSSSYEQIAEKVSHAYLELTDGNRLATRLLFIGFVIRKNARISAVAYIMTGWESGTSASRNELRWCNCDFLAMQLFPRQLICAKS